MKEKIKIGYIGLGRRGTGVLKSNFARMADVEIAVLCEDKFVQAYQSAGVRCLNLGKTQAEMAMRLYATLREAEKICNELIVIKPQSTDGIMAGVLNRLEKACASQDILH